MTLKQVKRELKEVAKEAIEVAHRIEFMGKDKNGELVCGNTEIRIFCTPDTPVAELASAVRVGALRKLQKEGYCEVVLSRMYKEKPNKQERECA
jgi:hypothetical protein